MKSQVKLSREITSLINVSNRVFKLLLASSIFIFLFSSLLFGQENYGSAFVHEAKTAKKANTGRLLRSNTASVIDNPLTNNQPERVLFVTQNYGLRGPYNDHEVGVQYLRDRWQIMNLDGSQISNGAKFNVLVLPRDNPNVYIHQNRNRSSIQIFTGSYDTRLQHPKLNGKPNAKFIVTPHVVENSSRTAIGFIKNPNPVGTYYRNGHWYIFNKNKVNMPMNATFNILISDDIISVNANRVSGNFFSINSEDTNQHPEKIIFTTQKSTSPTAANESNTGVWFSSGNWKIFNQSKAAMPTNEGFNVLVYEPLSETPRYRVYMFDKDGTRREYLDTAMLMYDPSKSENGRYVGLKKVQYDADDNLSITQVNSKATDYGYLHKDGNSISKFIANKFGQNIGLFTLTDNKKLIIRLDYNLDGIVDHMEIYDAINKRTSIFVLETEESLRNFDEILNGRNVFCQLERVSETFSGGPMPGFGIGANVNTVYSGCGENGVFSGHGVPPVPAFGNSRARPVDMMDNFCSDVMKNIPNSLPGSGMTSSWLGQFAEGIGMVAGAIVVITTAPLTAPAIVIGGAVVTGVAGLVMMGDALVDLARESNVLTPIPGEEAGYDWGSYCQRRASLRSSYSLDTLEKAMSQQDCPSPVENVSGIAMGPGGGGVTPPPNGPYQPYVPNTVENSRYCQNKMEHNDIQSIMNRVNGERCNNSVARPSPDGSGCGTTTTYTPGGQLQIGAGDIIAPKFTQDVKKLLDKVINPGRRNIPIPNRPR